MDDITFAKKEIRELLESFIKSPKDKSVQQKAIDLEKKYAGLTTVNDFTARKVVPGSLTESISFLQRIYQFGDGSFDDGESVHKAIELKDRLK